MESAPTSAIDVLAKIRAAHTLMSQALALLDEAGAPGEADAHLDLAVCCVADEIARMSGADVQARANEPLGPWGEPA